MPTPPVLQMQPDQDEINLRQLFGALWARKWLIAASAITAGTLAGGAAIVMPKSYKASALLSPVTDNGKASMGGLSSITSQLGGLASLAGISISGDSGKFESLAVLQSEALTEKYIAANNLLPVLYSKQWNATTNTWIDSNAIKQPTIWKANEFFKRKVRSVTTDAKTGLVTLTITWTDPKTAAKWANGLVQQTNAYMRTRAIEESERNIKYLTEQAEQATVVGVKQAVYRILETEISKVMLARGTEEYAFKVLDPAVPPERPSSPQLLIWTLGGAFFGIAIATFFALVRNPKDRQTPA